MNITLIVVIIIVMVITIITLKLIGRESILFHRTNRGKLEEIQPVGVVVRSRTSVLRRES